MGKTASSEDLKAALANYSGALELKAASSKTSNDLVALDAWFRGDLRERIQTVGYLTKEDIVKLMKWKLARGKFRPTLMSLVSSNDSKDVEAITKEALQLGTAAPSKVMNKLCELKGVGPATASAILSTYAFEDVPFLSDEASLAMGLGTPKYTAKYFEQFREAMQRRLQAEEGWKTMETLEMACWAWVVLGSQPAQSTSTVESSSTKRSAPADNGESALKAGKRPRHGSKKQ
ncbi:hypothetical protein K437DRAFT_254974 [Tilletiaria anomala UBC 951]|uniref:HhH-GPD domain-containing protein n=1 Tax=Tilletiaria anomala (strain ATCC 24038 / CBS 436.72 / UBC 951) TaxID=1037660 RepID=A0A066WIF4_TILAU|nr:uncharacterized protein K437DRAFT_254974 [Tilletiaria anomala UBC 951]KDN50804.1 hypothetical protein K437DRAFT_254974 [Tilletiaria anomala UBC 951]